KKTKILLVVSIILVMGTSCLASQSAIIGGIRNGVALGIMGEKNLSQSVDLRFGFEANTSNNPGLIFVGGKWFLTNISGRFPLFLSGGLVGYLGNNTEAGPYISLITEKFFDVQPLFLEFGIDIVNSGKLQLQIGYYF
ncbi:MAG: hypothetical protein WC890_07770, partial [Candidatus Margulisiibacteriota bacterium]